MSLVLRVRLDGRNGWIRLRGGKGGRLWFGGGRV